MAVALYCYMSTNGLLMKNKNIINQIIELLRQAPDERIRLELLELLFTPTELEQLTARYQIILGLIQQQKTQRELSLHLNLSIAKITRGSNELKRCSAKLRNYLTQFFAQYGD